MATLRTGHNSLDTPISEFVRGEFGPQRPRRDPGTTRDANELLSVLCPVFCILALGAVAIIAVSGQFPWFLVPLSVFLFFASCMPWRRFP